MIKGYNNFICENGFGQLSENIMIKLSITEFSNMLGSEIFESESDHMLLEKSYAMYELGMLYNNKKDWFEDEEKILMLESDFGTVLFKNGSAFILDNHTMKALNEGMLDDMSAAWEKVKASAKSSVDLVKSRSANIWNSISDGAKRVWKFTKKIVSAIKEITTSSNFWTTIAIVLQITAAVTPLIPAAGQILGPVLLGIAGAIEIGIGVYKMKKAWKYLSAMEINKMEKAKKSLAEGAPLVIAGSCSILLGLNDVIMAPKAAIPGVAAASTTALKASEKWAGTFAGQFAHGTEHFLANGVSKLVSKMGANSAKNIGAIMGSGGSAVAATAISTIFLMVGKGLLGNVFDGIIYAGGKISELFQFLIALPEKFSKAISNFIKSATTPAAKIIANSLKSFLGPALDVIKKLVSTYIKPIAQPMIDFIGDLAAEYPKTSKTIDKLSSAGLMGPLPKAVSVGIKTINSVPAIVPDKDVKQIKKLNEDRELDYLYSFQNFGLV
jgi:hypothetical protein